jgi:hypothetical protein
MENVQKPSNCVSKFCPLVLLFSKQLNEKGVLWRVMSWLEKSSLILIKLFTRYPCTKLSDFSNSKKDKWASYRLQEKSEYLMSLLHRDSKSIEQQNYVGFENLVEVDMESTVLWLVIPWSWKTTRHLGGTYHHYLHGRVSQERSRQEQKASWAELAAYFWFFSACLTTRSWRLG